MMPEKKPDEWKYLAIHLTKNQIIKLPVHHKVALAMIELVFGNLTLGKKIELEML